MNPKKALLIITNRRILRYLLFSNKFKLILLNHNLTEVNILSTINVDMENYINKYFESTNIKFNIIKFNTDTYTNNKNIVTLLKKFLKRNLVIPNIFPLWRLQNIKNLRGIKSLILYLPFLLFINRIKIIRNKLFYFSFYNGSVIRLLKSINPEFVIISNLFMELELEFLVAGHIQQIPIISFIDGWDSCLAIDIFFKIEHFYIWGDIDEQLILLNKNYKTVKNIYKVGIYFYEDLKKLYEQHLTKIPEIKKQVGIPSNAKVILISSNGYQYIGTQEQTLINILLKAIDTKRLENTYLLIRPYMGKYRGNANYYSIIKNHPHVKFWIPHKYNIEGNNEYCTITEHPLTEYSKMLTICDINLNILSMNFLESRICNVPSISYLFTDIKMPLKCNLKLPTLQNMIKYGLLKLWVSSQNETLLIETINDVLSNKYQYLDKQKYLILFGIDS